MPMQNVSPVLFEDTRVAQAFVEVLPKYPKVLSINWLSTAAQSALACITADGRGGEPDKYFLKCAPGEAGKSMLNGEYHAMFEIFRTTPSSVPRPYGCGRFDQDGVEIHFLLTDYIDMKNELPDPVALSRVIAHLHRTSMSPTGEFGFFATTCHGKVPQRVTWERSWTSFYRNLLQAAIRKDFEANGPWPPLEKVAPIILNKVVPRLLGALESGGRSIKPALIHGDLWEGNIAVRRGSGDILLIDAAAYYAHSEMEIGMWRCERHAIHDPKFTNAYLQQMPKDEPVEEWDDRNRLYCVKMNIVHSAHHRNAKERQTAFEDMCYLVDKYGVYIADARPQVARTESFMQAIEAAKFH